MYRYFYIRTDHITDSWSTKQIESCIEDTKLFIKEMDGNYSGIGFYCLVSLMNVKNWDSWNNLDYDCEYTNYINVVTSKSGSGDIPERSGIIIWVLSNLLNASVREE